MRPAFFRLFRGTNSQYYFTLHSKGNGEPILRSEGYTSKTMCLNGISSVREHAPFDRYYDRKGSGYGKLWFNLSAANHKIIGTSEMYSTNQAREVGIAAVKRDAPNAQVVDQARP